MMADVPLEVAHIVMQLTQHLQRVTDASLIPLVGGAKEPVHLRRHCCVVRSRGAFVGSNAAAGSDHDGEFVERGCHSEVPVAGVDAELVVASS